MLRNAFLWASTNPWLARQLPRRGFARRAVRRFMPGETVEAGLIAADDLGRRGVPAVLTMLGEEVHDEASADAVAAHYRDAEARVARAGLDVELSVKPTHLGLSVSRERVRDAILDLAGGARSRGRKVWIDMEGSAWTDATLELARAVRERTEAVGVCVQANLKRTERDLEALLGDGLSIRLVKGAYLEPPSIAYERKSDVDAAYLRLARTMLDFATTAGTATAASARYAFGTHDPVVIDALRQAGLGRVARCEIQMLYGIRPAAQRELAQAGVPLRVLISYGDSWFPWYMRRLAERPANVLFLLRSLVAR